DDGGMRSGADARRRAVIRHGFSNCQSAAALRVSVKAFISMSKDGATGSPARTAPTSSSAAVPDASLMFAWGNVRFSPRHVARRRQGFRGGAEKPSAVNAPE